MTDDLEADGQVGADDHVPDPVAVDISRTRDRKTASSVNPLSRRAFLIAVIPHRAIFWEISSLRW